jgi:DNA-binding transcriptional ArsR family regulator
MSTPFRELAELDRLVHDPTRLAILTALAASGGADFLFLQNITGLTKGNLSAHLSKLQEAGLVEIEKRLVENRPHTFARLSENGRKVIQEYWATLERLRKDADRWQGIPVPEPTPS